VLPARRRHQAISALDFFPPSPKGRAAAPADATRDPRRGSLPGAAAIGTGELHGRTWVTRKSLWADRWPALAGAPLRRSEAKLLWLEGAGEVPPDAISFGFEGAHFARATRSSRTRNMRQLQLGANQAIARIGAIVHYPGPAAPRQEEGGCETRRTERCAARRTTDELLAEAEKTFDLSTGVLRTAAAPARAGRRPSACPRRSAVRAAPLRRASTTELVEVAVARAAG
jgi:hypothetical protein